MPRVSRGPHLYLKSRPDGEPLWYIRDGKRRLSTGCGQGDAEGARQALQEHIGATAKPAFGDGHPARVRVADVIMLYAQDRVPKLARPEEAATRLDRVLEFFGANTVREVTKSTCAAFARWRMHQGAPGDGEPVRRDRAVAGPSVRRELADLQSALNHAFKSHKLSMPISVDMPDAAPARDRWLTRGEAARLLMGCLGWLMVPASDIRSRQEIWRPWCRYPDMINRHAARFVMIGLRTGTRHGAILALGWRPHQHGGHIDLAKGVLYRRAADAAETKKKRPAIPMQVRLWQHMRRWRRLDGHFASYVVAWNGARIVKLRRSFETAVRLAGLGSDVTPHVLRHTAVSWSIQDGTSLWDAAGYFGMNVDMIRRVYGHHANESLARVAARMR